MKKRIFAILTLALTLVLFVFPVFAAPFNSDDISLAKIGSFSGTVTSSSNEMIGNITLEEGLYIFDCDFSYVLWGEDGEIFSGSFFIKTSSSSGSSILLSSPISHGDSVYYIYVTSPIYIYINPQSSLAYTVDVYSTKHYNDFVQEGYNNGLDIGYDTGYEVGYGDAEAEINSDLEASFESGYNAGKTIGYNEGKEAGYILGEADGWQNAIEDADEVKTAIGGIFTGIFDGSVDAFNELTEGITIMGLTLKQILLTIVAIGVIGICIWLFALKK